MRRISQAFTVYLLFIINSVINIGVFADPGWRPVQCYECTSYMTQCKDTVDNRHQVVFERHCRGKCFLTVREDNAIYRGCFDDYKGVETLRSDYTGCRNQTWNNVRLPWCFCASHLCNGVSMRTLLSAATHDDPETTVQNDQPTVPSKHVPAPRPSKTTPHEDSQPINAYHHRMHDDYRRWEFDEDSGGAEVQGVGTSGSSTSDVSKNSVSKEDRMSSEHTSIVYDGDQTLISDAAYPALPDQQVPHQQVPHQQVPHQQVPHQKVVTQQEAVPHQEIVPHKLPDTDDSEMRLANQLAANMLHNTALRNRASNTRVSGTSETSLRGAGGAHNSGGVKSYGEFNIVPQPYYPMEQEARRSWVNQETSHDMSDYAKSAVNEEEQAVTAQPTVKNQQAEVGSQIQCSVSGFYQNPDDCNSFIACITGPLGYSYYLHAMRCPAQLQWDNKLKTCTRHSTTCSNNN